LAKYSRPLSRLRVQDQLLHSQQFRTTISALAAFIAYGLWAFYVNMDHGTNVGIKSALTQGSYSCVLTLSMAYITEWIYQLSSQQRFQLQATFIITCLLLYSTSWGINALLGTPEILMTIFPGAVIGTLYTFGYTLTLSKLT